MGRKKIEFDEKEVRQIHNLAVRGLSDNEIAAILERCSEATLKRHCADALASGRAKGKGRVKITAHEMATSGKCPAMTIFYLKTQCGWRETDHDRDAMQGPSRILTPTVGEGPESE